MDRQTIALMQHSRRAADPARSQSLLLAAETARQHGPERLRGPHPLPLFFLMAAREIGADRARWRALLAGLRRYQNAPLPLADPPLPVHDRIGAVRLLCAGGPEEGTPLVVVPSILNAASVLDHPGGRSLVRHLARDGHRTYLVDWGPTSGAERQLGLAGLVEARLLPLLERLAAGRGQGRGRGWGRPVRLLGYCLGGTLAIAAAQLLGRRLDRLVLLAAPWHFAGYPDEARRAAAPFWRMVEPVADMLGALPFPFLNPLFWALDERAVVRKFEALGEKADRPFVARFAAVEDWAGSGAPIPAPAAAELFLDGFAEDCFGRGKWRVRGARINPANITAPILQIRASRDRITPFATGIRQPNVTNETIAAGHVGMILGARAGELLFQPLSNWLHQR